MRITRLEVQHVRILEKVTLAPAAGLNVIVGANASGKTSLLEAIHLVGTGRSFRTTRAREVISRGAEGLTVFAAGRDDGREYRLGIRKALPDQTEIHVDGRRESGASALAVRLPLVLITPESHQVVSGGPRQRRSLIDWGVFHVEHGFHEEWLAFHRALKQRNAAMKARRESGDGLAVWEAAMAEPGERLNARREAYVAALGPALQQEIGVLAPELAIELSFRRGWADDVGLADAMCAQRERDRVAGHTSVGPHRAELVVMAGGVPAAGVLSRGQEKLTVIALKLAQLRLLQERSGKAATILIDDLPAELDPERRQRLLRRLKELDAQVFITSTERDLVETAGWESKKVFHVEQGHTREVL